MKRREFIAGLGGAAAWPVVARAQQPAVPVVGFLVITSPGASAPLVAAFRQGLSESGYVEGRNVAIDLRSAEGQFDRLPSLAADLVRRQVAVIFTNGGPVGIRAATAQTATIPIVFAMGEDPVKEGLVASLNRPGGDVTGFVSLANQLNSKRLSLLRDTVPKSKVLAYLINSTHPNAETEIKEAQAAAAAMRLELLVLTASTERAIESAFAAMVQQRVGGLSVSRDPSFIDRREQLAALAARHGIPAIYDRRDFPAAGSLMSYGTSGTDARRQSGVYTGRILRGEKPADLPVQVSTKFEFVINLKTAKALGLEIPPGVLAIADEAIE
jgi:putative tryptophan/tyrosine transport system substrate-binding protein